MESEFFGYASGAFTGAKSGGRVGLFELADKGTLFLDEIGELPLSLQSKLLRALESGEIRPVGSNQSKKVDVRIIAATNRNLEEMVERKEFREDLYYRLQIIPLYLPPLRERREDIVPLAEHYLQVYNKKHHRSCYLAESAKNELLRYDWPGNIRELRNLMERIVIISEVDAIVQMRILEEKTLAPGEKGVKFVQAAEMPENFYEAVAKFEAAHIDQMIHLCDGDVAKAAERMGVHKSMIYKRLKKGKEE
jgi:transcriptional regulator with PAS, ATPase and Fis domain